MNEKEKRELTALIDRGVENFYPNRQFVLEKLLAKKPLTFYLGIDPTGPTLHIGHAIVLRKLALLQKLSHKIILLIGDFTAAIGDPTGKDKTRKPLAEKEIKKNVADYKKQASKFLRFAGKNPAVIKYNSAWLKKMNFSDVLALASHMTVEQMLKRDMFEERQKAHRPIFIHEFLYPLLQGYDNVAMKVDGELGGNDQTFNMLVGRQLSKQILNKEKIIIVTKLLTDSTGRKMGKSEGNMITLNNNATEMFGKVMSWTDEMIVPGFELCTDVDMEEVKDVEKSIRSGLNPKNFKVQLGKEIVKIYHGEAAAEKSAAAFEETFRKGGTPDDIKSYQVKGMKLGELLVTYGLVKSKSDFVRLINSGAISEIGGQKIKNKDFLADRKIILKIGKNKFAKLVP